VDASYASGPLSSSADRTIFSVSFVRSGPIDHSPQRGLERVRHMGGRIAIKRLREPSYYLMLFVGH